MTSFLLLPHKFFKGTHRNPKVVLAKSRSVVICLCFRILFGRSFRNQIDSLGKQTLLTRPFTARVDDGVCQVVLAFTSVDKIMWCDHSNEISLEVLSCGVICFKKFYKMKFGSFVEFAFGHIWQ